jgi:hypothetical protein
VEQVAVMNEETRVMLGWVWRAKLKHDVYICAGAMAE